MSLCDMNQPLLTSRSQIFNFSAAPYNFPASQKLLLPWLKVHHLLADEPCVYHRMQWEYSDP